jgi:exonuclease III
MSHARGINSELIKKNTREALLIHLNINSIQNKFEELKILNDQLKSHIIFISETKNDKSYPNSQFSMAGYIMYRLDRKKGGG